MNRKSVTATGFLFSSSSFLSGAGTVMNMAGNYYNYTHAFSDPKVDEKALRNDFKMVGLAIYESKDSLDIQIEKEGIEPYIKS